MKKTNNAYEIRFKDEKGKIEDEKIKLYCDDVVGKWKNQKTKITKKKPKKTDDTNDIVQQIKDLKELHDSGALTKEEFEKAKKKLLN